MACECLGCRIAATITEYSAEARPRLPDGNAEVSSVEALGALASNAAGIIAAHPPGAAQVAALTCLMSNLTKALSMSGVDASMSLTVSDEPASAEVLH